MSDGTTHLFVNLMLGGAMNLAAVNLGASPEVASGIIVGGMVATLLTPDLDLNNSLPKAIGATLPGWRAIWWPYSKLNKHRNFWSHSPVFSTAVRFAYLTFFLSPIIIGLWYFGVLTIEPMFIVSCFGAMCVQDFSHLLLDGIPFGRRNKKASRKPYKVPQKYK